VRACAELGAKWPQPAGSQGFGVYAFFLEISLICSI
jgi:hypothetical protein